ncbi:MAG: UDP-N-acetylmuramate--L-alanine ligase [bacterium]|nr:UDP-N-acetylmuramate--L-alanine ligase [bacterium]
MRQVIKLKTVHFIGIGGIGTSALARWFLRHGWKVSGSDSNASSITDALKKEGVKIFIGHHAKNISQKTKLVIHSAAISAENPEFEQAGFLKIPIKSYAEFIGDLTKLYKTLAVSGSHGKSTTTALLSLVLIKAGFDPTVIVGTKLKEFGDSNFRNGKSEYLVLEADEYQKSFLRYSPAAAIITNIDREHLDIYKNLNEIKKVFLKFINNIQFGGILVVNKDDKNLFSLKNKIQKIAEKNKLKIYWYSIFPRDIKIASGYRPRNDGKNVIASQRRSNLNKSMLSRRMSAILKIPGEHNLSNSLAAYTLAKVLGIKEKDIFNAVGGYRGAWRRMELRGYLNLKPKTKNLKPIIYDDYAHHPTEIKATLAGIAQKWPKTAIICVFQPHQAQRLSALFKEFVGAFDNADVLILLDIFKVKGRDNVSHNINSKKLAEAVEKHATQLKAKNSKLKTIIYLPHHQKLPQVLQKVLLSLRESALSPRQSAIVVMMGAGDIYKLTDKIVK